MATLRSTEAVADSAATDGEDKRTAPTSSRGSLSMLSRRRPILMLRVAAEAVVAVAAGESLEDAGAREVAAVVDKERELAVPLLPGLLKPREDWDLLLRVRVRSEHQASNLNDGCVDQVACFCSEDQNGQASA